MSRTNTDSKPMKSACRGQGSLDIRIIMLMFFSWKGIEGIKGYLGGER